MMLDANWEICWINALTLLFPPGLTSCYADGMLPSWNSWNDTSECFFYRLEILVNEWRNVCFQCFVARKEDKLGKGNAILFL